MSDRTTAITLLTAAWFVIFLAIRAILRHTIPWALADCGLSFTLLFLAFMFNRTKPVRSEE